MTSGQAKKSAVEHVRVSPDQSGRRIDNYLTAYLKGIPKTRIYKMLRKGEVRVNSSRVRQDYRLAEQDIIRIPPVYREASGGRNKIPSPALLGLVNGSIVYEDDFLLALNKPAGLAVHAGSGEQFGVIEVLRALRPDQSGLELVHRLDKPTSGCLLLAKEHRILRTLHSMLRDHRVTKHYLALLKGTMEDEMKVSLPLKKNELQSGERMVQVHSEGKIAVTRFRTEKKYRGASFSRIEIATGRTHQIRVHAAAIGHPVAGDDKYGDREFNQKMKACGLKRMYLHAESLTLKLPWSGQVLTITAPLPEDLLLFLRHLKK